MNTLKKKKQYTVKSVALVAVFELIATKCENNISHFFHG